MKLLLKQKSKEMFTADFEVLEGEDVVGTLFLNGSLASIDVKLTGKLYDKEFSMAHKGGFSKKYRLYEIFENGEKTGEIYINRIKTSFLARLYVPLLNYRGVEYKIHENGIGEFNLEGAKVDGNKMVITIYNDLYNYEITCDDYDEAFRTVIYTIYGYITSRFSPGKKTTKSVKKMIYTNYDKRIIF